MMVNLPCLMGSCPNFLRPTCSYTECWLSFLTGSCPTEWTPASYSSYFLDSYWPTSPRMVRIIQWMQHHLWHRLALIRMQLLSSSIITGFLSRTLPGIRSRRSPARPWNLHCLYLSFRYAAVAAACSVSRRMSFSIFSGSYFVPFFKIAKNILRSLHAITINDCIFFNGFLALPV